MLTIFLNKYLFMNNLNLHLHLLGDSDQEMDSVESDNNINSSDE